MNASPPASRPRYSGTPDGARSDPETVLQQVRDLPDDELHNLAEVVRQVQIERAIDNGDHDAIVAAAFEVGFGRDGLGVLPWVEGSVVICPGGLVSKSKTSHRCRFVSVDDVWVWDSALALTLGIVFNISFNIVENGGNSIAANIANTFAEANDTGRGALIASGLVLFAITLVVNMAARAIIYRRREFRDSAA